MLCRNLQAWLRDREDRLLILRRAARRSVAVEPYHVIIIDTQGAVGELQKTAAMAADVILSPIKPDVLSASEFADGTLRMMESLNSLSDFGPDFRSGELHVVISALERINNARQVADQVRRSFAGDQQVKGILDTVIPHAAAYTAATTARVPVHHYDRRKTEKSSWDVIHRLAWELFPALNGMYVDGQGQPEELEA